VVDAQGHAVNNGAARKYLERKIRELEYQVSLSAPPAPPSPPIDQSAFGRLFLGQ